MAQNPRVAVATHIWSATRNRDVFEQTAEAFARLPQDERMRLLPDLVRQAPPDVLHAALAGVRDVAVVNRAIQIFEAENRSFRDLLLPGQPLGSPQVAAGVLGHLPPREAARIVAEALAAGTATPGEVAAMLTYLEPVRQVELIAALASRVPPDVLQEIVLAFGRAMEQTRRAAEKLATSAGAPATGSKALGSERSSRPDASALAAGASAGAAAAAGLLAPGTSARAAARAAAGPAVPGEAAASAKAEAGASPSGRLQPRGEKSGDTGMAQPGDPSRDGRVRGRAAETVPVPGEATVKEGDVVPRRVIRTDVGGERGLDDAARAAAASRAMLGERGMILGALKIGGALLAALLKDSEGKALLGALQEEPIIKGGHPFAPFENRGGGEEREGTSDDREVMRLCSIYPGGVKALALERAAQISVRLRSERKGAKGDVAGSLAHVHLTMARLLESDPQGIALFGRRCKHVFPAKSMRHILVELLREPDDEVRGAFIRTYAKAAAGLGGTIGAAAEGAFALGYLTGAAAAGAALLKGAPAERNELASKLKLACRAAAAGTTSYAELGSVGPLVRLEDLIENELLARIGQKSADDPRRGADLTGEFQEGLDHFKGSFELNL